jgi:nicotinamide-nucleotide amidase
MTPTPTDHGVHQTAAILSIGDELALGQVLDTNSAWLADRLFSLGVRTIEHATVEDDAERIAATIDRLAEASDLLLITGGLGPTADDLTRDALAAVLGDELVEDENALSAIRSWFSGRAGSMPERNAVQALRPASSECLANPHGTAPGLFVRSPRHACDIACLPGPPHEMRPMVETEIVPRIRRAPGVVLGARALLSFGLGESTAAQRLGDLMDRDRERAGCVLVGTTASRGVVSVRLRHVGQDRDAVARDLDATEAEVTDRLTPSIFDRRDLTAGDSADLEHALPARVLSLLRDRGERLVVVESCTGGLLGELVTAVPGSSDAFVGGWLTYTNESKAGLVGVEPELIRAHGAVSEPVAAAMARGGLERSALLGGAHHALAITGVAGPNASEAKPAGTVWIARASGTDRSVDLDVRRFAFKGDRTAVRGWSARTALGMLRLGLTGDDMPLLGEQEAHRTTRPA